VIVFSKDIAIAWTELWKPGKDRHIGLRASVQVTLLLLISLLFLSACGKEQITGPADVRWDREICARCAMAISDHGFAAEVRGGRKDKKPKVYKFDDIGCAVVWLDQQNWKDDPKTEIWVKEKSGDKWLDARKAWYKLGEKTPMNYGFGAYEKRPQGGVDFKEFIAMMARGENMSNPAIRKKYLEGQ